MIQSALSDEEGQGKCFWCEARKIKGIFVATVDLLNSR